MRLLALAVLAVALAVPVIGCGDDGGGGQVQEEALRDCLTEEGLTVEASDLGSSAGLGNATPDFRVMSEQGEIADILVEGSEQKAENKAADAAGAKQSFGAGQADIVVKENAVIVYERTPPDDFSEQVETCLS